MFYRAPFTVLASVPGCLLLCLAFLALSLVSRFAGLGHHMDRVSGQKISAGARKLCGVSGSAEVHPEVKQAQSKDRLQVSSGSWHYSRRRKKQAYGQGQGAPAIAWC